MQEDVLEQEALRQKRDAQQESGAAMAESQEPMLFCPVCSLRLDQRKCKLFCQQCGYYMSCADYY